MREQKALEVRGCKWSKIVGSEEKESKGALGLMYTKTCILKHSHLLLPTFTKATRKGKQVLIHSFHIHGVEAFSNRLIKLPIMEMPTTSLEVLSNVCAIPEIFECGLITACILGHG